MIRLGCRTPHGGCLKDSPVESSYDATSNVQMGRASGIEEDGASESGETWKDLRVSWLQSVDLTRCLGLRRLRSQECPGQHILQEQ